MQAGQTQSSDDILDAYAAAWTALRIAENGAKRIPEHSSIDAKGLRMEMWYKNLAYDGGAARKQHQTLLGKWSAIEQWCQLPFWIVGDERRTRYRKPLVEDRNGASVGISGLVSN